tara:strand:+ start:348 stop:524 length:177 start_codon:yes stop_codon:yes gene_type:complete
MNKIATDYLNQYSGKTIFLLFSIFFITKSLLLSSKFSFFLAIDLLSSVTYKMFGKTIP